jgi:hypothetical protein
MDGLTLLDRARRAGLAVRVQGETLVIRGPKRAEPLARMLIEHKPDVVAALTPKRACEAGEAKQWRNRYAAHISHWFLHGQRDWYDAERIAFGELILDFHRQHGARFDSHHCAGCGDLLAADAGTTVDHDSVRIHFGAVHGVDCLIAFGQRWRSAAVAGLQGLGIEPPIPFDLL